MMKKTFEMGPIRPPSEAYSLLLRVTENCPWNNCKFCTLYKGTSFRPRTVEEVKEDIDVMAYYRDTIRSYVKNDIVDDTGILEQYDALSSEEEKYCFQMVYQWFFLGKQESLFLQDANSIVLKPEHFAEMISYVRVRLPEIQRITTYARADTLSRLSLEDFKLLKQAGLDRIHSGYETGSNEILTLIGKGTTSAQQIQGGKKVKEAGIELSIYFMPGVGGKTRSQENAMETANVINAVNPDFVRLRTFVLKKDSLMANLLPTGEFQECTDMEKLLEIRTLLTHIKDCDGFLASDQIINLLEQIKGSLQTDIPSMIAYIDTFLALPKQQQRRFQLARRMGFQGDFTQLSLLSQQYQTYLDEQTAQVTDPNDWEALLQCYLENYI